MGRQFMAILRKDLVRELRTREMLVSMFLFVMLALVIFHYAFGVDDRLLQLDGVGASARLGGSATATGAVRLSAEGEAAARTAIDQFLAACIATTDIRPVPKCGMINDELDPATTYTEVVWSMTAAPTYRFEGWSSTLPGFPLTSLTGGAFRVDSAQWWWSWTDIELYGWLEYEDGAFTWVSDYRVE